MILMTTMTMTKEKTMFENEDKITRVVFLLALIVVALDLLYWRP